MPHFQPHIAELMNSLLYATAVLIFQLVGLIVDWTGHWTLETLLPCDLSFVCVLMVWRGARLCSNTRGHLLDV